MNWLRGILLVGFCSLLFWAAGFVLPGFFEATNLAALLGVFGLAWTFLLHLFNKTSDLSSLHKVISAKESERLGFQIQAINRRFWYLSFLLLLAFITAIVVRANGSPEVAVYAPLFYGALVGIALVLLLLCRGWISEIQTFRDSIEKRDADRQRTENSLRQMTAK